MALLVSSFDTSIFFGARRPVGRLCEPSARSSSDCALAARAPLTPRSCRTTLRAFGPLVVRLRAGSTRSTNTSFLSDDSASLSARSSSDCALAARAPRLAPRASSRRQAAHPRYAVSSPATDLESDSSASVDTSGSARFQPSTLARRKTSTRWAVDSSQRISSRASR